MQTISHHRLNETDKERLLASLNAWHKIEFFIPFALDKSVVEDRNDWKRIHWLSKTSLQRGDTLFQFPQLRVGNTAQYNLFVGIFDKSDIARICDKALGTAEDDDTTLENKERGDLEGETCFARIKLNERGEPLFDEVSVSTVPWALGAVRQTGLEGLNAHDFEQAKNDLTKALQSFANTRESDDNRGPSPLTARDVVSLHDLFRDWAQFAPTESEHIALLQRIELQHKTADEAQENGEATDEEPTEPEITILNSFFIQDIEKAMQSVHTGTMSRSLFHYLTRRSPESCIDLYSDKGQQAILEKMHPARMNRGRWFDEPSHSMSLMQQFAINMAFEANEHHGIYSVNGPPGTGKTTLLRDIIAENVVRRARRLTSLHTAADAFENAPVRIPIGTGVTVRKLKSELTGFEMVVASSNNAAVNNISHELPKQTALGNHWRPQSYLEKTARKVGAQTNGGKLHPLLENEQRWGLVACALGNSSNRYNFIQKFAFYPENLRQRCKDLDLLRIQDSLDDYDGPSFSEAKDIFISKSSAVDKEISRRADYADLMRELCGHTLQSFTQGEAAQIAETEQKLNQIRCEKGLLEQKDSDLNQQAAQLEKRQMAQNHSGPGFFARLFHTRKARVHAAENRALAFEAQSLKSAINANGTSLSRTQTLEKQAEAQLQNAEEEMTRRRCEWDAKQARLAGRQQQYKALNIPKAATDLDNTTDQLQGLWGDSALATLRTELFQAALSLHEAWLAEVGKNKNTGGLGFGGNIYAISDYLKRLPPLESEHTLIIWQSLFMIIPVISTTFAALANQFKSIGQESLGWLFTRPGRQYRKLLWVRSGGLGMLLLSEIHFRSNRSSRSRHSLSVPSTRFHHIQVTGLTLLKQSQHKTSPMHVMNMAHM